MKRLRMAVIGAGHLGRIHARLLKTQDNVELVGLVDTIASARELAASEVDAPVYAHHYEVIGKIDAAIVATPTILHHEVALELLRAGVHCLVEKPLTTTVAEAESLIAAADEQRLVLQAGHVERFNPALAAVESLSGEIRYLEAARASGYSFRSTDIGVVLDLMIHDIDLALALAGGRVVDVQASALTVIGPHEDIAQARLTFDNGCVANLFATRVSPNSQRTLALYGDRTHAFVDLTARTARLVRPCGQLLDGEFDVRGLTPADVQHYKAHLFSELLPVETTQAPECNAILAEQQDFVSGIQEGRSVRVPGTAGRDALVVAETILGQIADRSRHAIPMDKTPSILQGPHFPRLATESANEQVLRRAG